VENLHWIDPTSDAWVASLVERLPAAILFLATYRPTATFSGIFKGSLAFGILRQVLWHGFFTPYCYLPTRPL
jgi:hypothetical protein